LFIVVTIGLGIVVNRSLGIKSLVSDAPEVTEVEVLPVDDAETSEKVDSEEAVASEEGSTELVPADDESANP